MLSQPENLFNDDKYMPKEGPSITQNNFRIQNIKGYT